MSSAAPKSASRVKSPAQAVRKAQAASKAATAASNGLPGGLPAFREACDESAAASKILESLPVPMTLKEICRLMGPGCDAKNFAASALETLAGQLCAVAQFAESSGSYDQWQVIEHIVERMKCASEVVTWLESETTELPESEARS